MRAVDKVYGLLPSYSLELWIGLSGTAQHFLSCAQFDVEVGLGSLRFVQLRIYAYFTAVWHDGWPYLLYRVILSQVLDGIHSSDQVP